MAPQENESDTPALEPTLHLTTRVTCLLNRLYLVTALLTALQQRGAQVQV